MKNMKASYCLIGAMAILLPLLIVGCGPKAAPAQVDGVKNVVPAGAKQPALQQVDSNANIPDSAKAAIAAHINGAHH